MAGALPRMQLPSPPGLFLGYVGKDYIGPAVCDVESVLGCAADGQDGTKSEMAEVGYSFSDAFREGRAKFVPAKIQLEQLPRLEALLHAAMAVVQWPNVTSASALKRRGLNVILRRYSVGQRLGYHKDAIGLFDEPIWGCVLRSGGAGLRFRRDGSTDRRDDYCLNEQPGLSFLMTGEARYDWLHGVEDCGANVKRISVTLRWFRDDAIWWHGATAAEQRLWTAMFVAALRRCGLSEDDTLDAIAVWNKPCPGKTGAAASVRIFMVETMHVVHS